VSRVYEAGDDDPNEVVRRLLLGEDPGGEVVGEVESDLPELVEVFSQQLVGLQGRFDNRNDFVEVVFEELGSAVGEHVQRFEEGREQLRVGRGFGFGFCAGDHAEHVREQRGDLEVGQHGVFEHLGHFAQQARHALGREQLGRLLQVPREAAAEFFVRGFGDVFEEACLQQLFCDGEEDLCVLFEEEFGSVEELRFAFGAGAAEQVVDLGEPGGRMRSSSRPCRGRRGLRLRRRCGRGLSWPSRAWGRLRSRSRLGA